MSMNIDMRYLRIIFYNIYIFLYNGYFSGIDCFELCLGYAIFFAIENHKAVLAVFMNILLYSHLC